MHILVQCGVTIDLGAVISKNVTNAGSQLTFQMFRLFQKSCLALDTNTLSQYFFPKEKVLIVRNRTFGQLTNTLSQYFIPKEKVLIVKNCTFGQLKGKLPFFWSKYTIFGAPFSSTVKWKSALPTKARLQRGVVHCAAENWFQNQCTAYGWELQGESSVPQRWS